MYGKMRGIFKTNVILGIMGQIFSLGSYSGNKKNMSDTIRKEGFEKFTVIPNTVFENVKDARALGVICYLFSKSCDWRIRTKQLQNHFGFGRDACTKSLRILEEAGYMRLESKRDESGQMSGREWVLSFHPNNGKPEQRKTRSSGKPKVGKPVDIPSTDEEPNTDYIPNTEKDIKAGEISKNATGANFSIHDFYKLWGMSKPSHMVEMNWFKLTESEKTEIATHLPKYLEFTPDTIYRTKPSTYLFRKYWTEPLVDRRRNAVIKQIPKAAPNPTQIPPSTTKYHYVN